ncbi:hypothetical protein SPBR_06644 [Sporothrix brasiliensis 5110]|uniref:Uncharacterized protein n=1 Tax=Sporothrix brasiliensis 5110 TaxID=1398154 RepID=A0A0C2ET31_9PEZI|nr:uncharacterized protein SPBR_06644 [Sporothrix brasiliensis 5110]KIH89559.1 hypothetical protein SPBR_06644 [Sporothrix brasiliensis 5110]
MMKGRGAHHTGRFRFTRTHTADSRVPQHRSLRHRQHRHNSAKRDLNHQLVNLAGRAPLFAAAAPAQTVAVQTRRRGRQVGHLGADPARRVHVDAVNADAGRAVAVLLGGKAQALKHGNVPGRAGARAQQDAAAEGEGAVELGNLAGGGGAAGLAAGAVGLLQGVVLRVEPVHAVHDDGDGQGPGREARNDLLDLVGVDAQAVKGARARQAGVGLRGQVVRVAAARVLAVHADVVVGIVGGHVHGLDHGVERVDHVLPDGAGPAARLVAGGLVAGVVGLDHGQLVLGHAQGGPQEGLLADDEVRQRARQQGRADLGAPDLALLVERLGREHGGDGAAQAKGVAEVAEQADGVLGAARVVEAAAAGLGEDALVAQPVLEAAAGQVRGQLGDEQLAEAGVLAGAKQQPKVLVGDLGGVGGDLELEQVVLGRVEVDGVDAGGALQRVGQNVVAGTGDGEHDVLLVEPEQALVDAGVLPRKRIDVLVAELGVLGELVVVVDAPVVVLVEEGRQRQVGRQVGNGGLEGLGADLGRGALDRARQRGGRAGGRDGATAGRAGAVGAAAAAAAGQGRGVAVQVGGLGDHGVDALDDLVGQAGDVEGLLVAAEPDVVGDGAERVVARVDAEDGAEAVLEVVAAAGVEADAVELEPGAPERAAQEAGVAVDEAARVVAEAEVVLALDVKVNGAQNAVGRQQRGQRVDDGVVVGDHGQAVGHGDQVGAAVVRAVKREVAVAGEGGRGGGGDDAAATARKTTFVVFEAELAGVLADDVHVGPAEAGEALPRNGTQRRREVDQVHAREEVGHVDVRGHGLNVPAGAAADVHPDALGARVGAVVAAAAAAANLLGGGVLDGPAVG